MENRSTKQSAAFPGWDLEDEHAILLLSDNEGRIAGKWSDAAREAREGAPGLPTVR